MIIAVVGAFEVGAAVLALGSTDTTGTPAATTTMTGTAPNGEPNEGPTEEPTAAGFTPRKSTFRSGSRAFRRSASALLAAASPTGSSPSTSGHRS
jgi:hypothetical protein